MGTADSYKVGRSINKHPRSYYGICNIRYNAFVGKIVKVREQNEKSKRTVANVSYSILTIAWKLYCT